MKDLRELFACWDSAAAMALDVGESHWKVTKWRQRSSIPVTAWPAVIKALKRKGKNVGADALLALHTGSKSTPAGKPNNAGEAA